jgi:hypothetical protein
VSVGSSYWGSAITPADPSGSRAVDSFLAPDTARSNHGCEAGSAVLPLVGSFLLGILRVHTEFVGATDHYWWVLFKDRRFSHQERTHPERAESFLSVLTGSGPVRPRVPSRMRAPWPP